MKKRLFIASSVEGLEAAYAVQENLEHDFEVTVWSQGAFELTKSTLMRLVEISKSVDAAAFVFSPDDSTIIRGKTFSVVRDNVLFELGLFMGSLGHENCFILLPKSASDLHLPTDLLGITPASYADDRSDANMTAALGPAANKIRRQLLPKVEGRTVTTNNRTPIESLLVMRPFRLYYNPPRYKRMSFGPNGQILEGNNKNEHSWRIREGKLEFLQLDKRVHSRFKFNPGMLTFQHTNDPDTLSLRNQYLEPDEPA